MTELPEEIRKRLANETLKAVRDLPSYISSKKIEQQIKEFEQKGGKIQSIPTGKSGHYNDAGLPISIQQRNEKTMARKRAAKFAGRLPK